MAQDPKSTPTSRREFAKLIGVGTLAPLAASLFPFQVHGSESGRHSSARPNFKDVPKPHAPSPESFFPPADESVTTSYPYGTINGVSIVNGVPYVYSASPRGEGLSCFLYGLRELAIHQGVRRRPNHERVAEWAYNAMHKIGGYNKPPKYDTKLIVTGLADVLRIDDPIFSKLDYKRLHWTFGFEDVPHGFGLLKFHLHPELFTVPRVTFYLQGNWCLTWQPSGDGKGIDTDEHNVLRYDGKMLDTIHFAASGHPPIVTYHNEEEINAPTDDEKNSPTAHWRIVDPVDGADESASIEVGRPADESAGGPAGAEPQA